MAGERHGRGMLCVNRPLDDTMGIKFAAAQNPVLAQYCLKQCFPNFFDGVPLFALTVIMDSHILAHISIQCQDDRNLKLKMFILQLILDGLRIHTNSICNNVLHDLTLITMIVAHFVSTKLLSIIYSNGHTK
jgi:hypothetical protein